MKAKQPKMTPELNRIINRAARFPWSALIELPVLARATETSVAYWENLKAEGNGPPLYDGLGKQWYDLGDVLAWMAAVDAGSDGVPTDE